MDLYEVLGVELDAGGDAIRAAYRSKAQKAHPDKEGGSQEAFVALQRAYDVLSDPDRRAQYDATGETRTAEELEREAEVVLGMMLMQTIEGMDVEQFDLVDIIRKAILLKMENHGKAIEVLQQQIAKKKKVLRRLKRMDGAENVLAALVSKKIVEHEKQVLETSQERGFGDILLATLANYEYDTSHFVPAEFRSFFPQLAHA